MDPPTRTDRNEVMRRQLLRREERRAEEEELLEANKEATMADAAAVRQGTLMRGMAVVQVSMGTVTLYGE